MIRDEKGQSIVETALVIPLLLLLIIGIVDVGKIIYTHSTLQYITQQTAREATLGRNVSELEQFANQQANNSRVSIQPDITSSGDSVTVKIQSEIEPLIPFDKLFPSNSITLSSTSTVRIE
ncbi:TadE/TadG family type IV pilus assembly protein [Radiobacillus sp. PE A8.2]|uniref:TadE/TadG family type IV pilus assembly protein n=1 Tax=Radiobacillus sp. PE A8.2 TaxID=3380349 RepID=UPI00388DD590